MVYSRATCLSLFILLALEVQGSVLTRGCVHCRHQGMDTVSNNTLWHLNNAQFVLRDPKCAEKLSLCDL